MPYQTPGPQQQGNGKAIAAMVLGICSLVFWCLPILGLPIAVVGLVLGVTNKNPAGAGQAKAGVIMSIIGLVLSIGNAIVGVIMAVNGQM
jgi:hypothetical protein